MRDWQATTDSISVMIKWSGHRNFKMEMFTTDGRTNYFTNFADNSGISVKCFEGREVSVEEAFYVQLPFRCWTNRRWEQTSLSVLSGLQHRLSGTRCHKQFSSVILCLFLNPDLKLFCSLRLLLNTDPTCRQRLWSYELMTVWRYRNSITIIIGAGSDHNPGLGFSDGILPLWDRSNRANFFVQIRK